ncbi:hypothetical protein [Actinocrispum sp. NPDC049592]|uniref:hypothetical protein n=1 Tax=Actinocrispum sp. NPDC049592 TaxID=3154835 RepID=UPI0034193E6D
MPRPGLDASRHPQPGRVDHGHELRPRPQPEVLGLGLAGFADPAVADEYLDLVADRNYGVARMQPVGALPKLKDDRALPAKPSRS